MLHWWSDDDIEILKQMYPNAPKEEILKALNGKNRDKTWTAIQKRASKLGIRRHVKNPGRPKKKKRYFIGKRELENLLNNTNLTIDEIAKKLRTDPDIIRRAIRKYEL